MDKLQISIPRVTTIARKHTNPPAPGHEHHTQIDGVGTGSPELNLPDSDVLVDRAMKRARGAEKKARRRMRKAGKTPSTEGTITATDSKVGLMGSIVVPQPVKVVPAGQTRETYADGQLLLQAADGVQELMMSRMFDGYFEERFRDMITVVAWGVGNLPAKKQKAITSLSRNLDKLTASWSAALPKLAAKLAQKNPKAPMQLVVQKAVELLDQELGGPLFMFNLYAESVKQERDGLHRTELGAVEVLFEDAFQLYFGGDLHCAPDGSKTKAQLPTTTYNIGDVFMPRVTATGLATVPGAKGPIGANALQLPYEMLDVLAIVFPLLGHEARHNVYHDVKGLEDELLSVVEKAIRDAHAAGTIKLQNAQMQLGEQTVDTIDLVAKLFLDWNGEVDADVVGGVLFSGPAFGEDMVISFPAMMVRDARVSTKVKFIRTTSHYTLHPQKDGSVGLVFEEHPVDYVRIYIVAAALEEIGFTAEAKKLRELADFAVGDELPKEIIYKDGDEQTDIEIKFATADLLAVAPVVAKAIIRTPLQSQLGKSCGDLVMFNAKRQAKVDAVTDLLVQGIMDASSINGSVFATYVGSGAAQAYMKLVRSGMKPADAAKLVNTAALQMIIGLRKLPNNLCPVPAAQSNQGATAQVTTPATGGTEAATTVVPPAVNTGDATVGKSAGETPVTTPPAVDPAPAK